MMCDEPGDQWHEEGEPETEPDIGVVSAAAPPI